MFLYIAGHLLVARPRLLDISPKCTELLYIAGHILVNDCGCRRLSTPMTCLARSRGGLSCCPRTYVYTGSDRSPSSTYSSPSCRSVLYCVFVEPIDRWPAFRKRLHRKRKDWLWKNHSICNSNLAEAIRGSIRNIRSSTDTYEVRLDIF
jgi:hypothetical protein